MNALTAGSPALPGFVLLPLFMAYLVLIVLVALRAGTSSRFLLLVFATRLAMSALPDFAFSSSPAGLSWNALVSVFLVAGGSLLLHRSRAVPLVLIPVMPLILVVLASLAINGDPAGAIESLVKYAYFVMICLVAYDAFLAEGAARVLSRLLWTFVLPIGLQFAAIALGIAKATESDGSASYIGGYNHEATFSLILLTALLTAVLHPAMKARYSLLIAAICITGIVAANYRTAIIGAAPLLLGLVMSSVVMAVPLRQRAVAAVLGSLLVLSFVPFIPGLAGDRFDAIERIAENPSVLIKAPGEFRAADMDLMSGRLYLWATYTGAWREGSQRQHLLGQGANAWEGRYRYYAHNTLVSTLYELGVAGVAAMLFLWGWMFALALTATAASRLTLILAHGGFILVNMATMPFWMIEGLLFYGLLCAMTVHAHLAARDARRRAQKAPGAPAHTAMA